jgi:hypothetical protein
MSARHRTARIVLTALLALFVVYIIAEIAGNPGQRQWDFRSYYYAAVTHADGGNPYDVTQLNRRSGGRTVPPFIYPPPTLFFFRLFALLSFPAAYQLWLIIKIILAAALIFIWRQYLFSDEPPLLFGVFLLLAFGATFYIDFVTGNVTILEQALLWGGIILLLRGRPLEFCIAIILASAFKLTPILFLLLLPVLGVRHAKRLLAGSAITAIAILAISYLVEPVAWQEFFRRLTAADEAGRMGNPSTLSLFRDVTQSIADKWAISLPDAIPLALYAIVVTGVVWFTWHTFARLRQSELADRDQVLAYLFCIAFALIMPRFKTYSFMLVLPPAYYAIRRCGSMPAFAFLVVLLALSASTPFPISPYLRLFWRYYPLFLTALIGGLMLRDIRSRTSAHPR